MSRVDDMNESCHIWWISYVTSVNVNICPCDRHNWIMSRVNDMNESCHIRIMSQVTSLNGSTCPHDRHQPAWASIERLPPAGVWHDSFICVARPICVCDRAHSHVWHDSLWHAWFICVTWLNDICEMTHSSEWHEWPMQTRAQARDCMYVCDVTHEWVIWMSDYMCVTLLIRTWMSDCMCVMSLMNEWYEWVTVCVWRHSFVRVAWRIHMCYVTSSLTL